MTSYTHRGPGVKGHMQIVSRLSLGVCIDISMVCASAKLTLRIKDVRGLFEIANAFGVHSDNGAVSACELSII